MFLSFKLQKKNNSKTGDMLFVVDRWVYQEVESDPDILHLGFCDPLRMQSWATT